MYILYFYESYACLHYNGKQIGPNFSLKWGKTCALRAMLSWTQDACAQALIKAMIAVQPAHIPAADDLG